ncbi:histidine phosphatase superfamily [Nemania sp. FL0031]|nr:histidine phosphatase superfamily [Nemania sp. FL0031]
MSDQDATTPRAFLCRHGEIEWTINGRYTGATELDLITNGINQVRGSGTLLVGLGKLIEPGRVARVFVSPRKRAQITYRLLFGGDVGNSPVPADKVTVTEDIAEWNYGNYEGLLTSEIQDRRRAKGLDSNYAWDIWRDGCEGGEEVTDRLDRLIMNINDIHRPCMYEEAPSDVVLLRGPPDRKTCLTCWLGTTAGKDTSSVNDAVQAEVATLHH